MIILFRYISERRNKCYICMKMLIFKFVLIYARFLEEKELRYLQEHQFFESKGRQIVRWVSK